MKVLKQHGINLEANKKFCDGCALGKACRQRLGTRTNRQIIVGEHMNADVFGPMQWRNEEYFCWFNPGFFWGGSTNSVEDRGQKERGSGGGSPLVRKSGGSYNLVKLI
jgi:hypothetical protein